MGSLTGVWRRIVRRFRTRRDLARARDRLLASPDTSREEQRLLRALSLRIDDRDTMYEGDGSHYLSVGLSAHRCIMQGYRAAGREPPDGPILDFASGYGRVLRFLRARFPPAEIVAAEVDHAAMDFCHRAFAAMPVVSARPFGRVVLPQRFDLIWCGSLLTHVDETGAIELLRLFHDHLSPRGLCIVSTHGWRSVDRMERSELTYGLSDEARAQVTLGFRQRGYGYANYGNQSAFGVSAVSRDRMAELVRDAGSWEEVLYLERGWDHHQDVFVLTSAASGRGSTPPTSD